MMPDTSNTILVVDDDTAVRQLVADLLQQSGYLVIEADGGPRGWRVLLRSAATWI